MKTQTLKKRRLISLMTLILVLMSTIITGCSDKTPETQVFAGNDEITAADAADTPEEETTKYYAADIPEGTDYGGYEFRILVNEVSRFVWGDVDVIAAEQNGEAINDAVYARNRFVEETLNVVIKPTESASVSGDLDKTVMAGEDAYDLAFAHTHGAFDLAQKELIMQLPDITALDLSSEWWDQNSLSDLSVNNKQFMMTGDIGTMYKKSIGIIMFHKGILADYNLDDPYVMMNNKEWTIDVMAEMGKMVSNDLNGDGKYDENDMYGLLYFCDMMGISLIGSGVKFVTKGADDIPALTFYDEKTQSVVEKLSTLLYNPQLSYSWSKVGKDEKTTFAMYQNNQSLFYYGELHSVATMRSMDADFGILPIPLYDSNQESYYHCVNPHVAPMVVIPKTIGDLDRTGYILDVMGAASKNFLTPAYYDITLKGKVTRDEQSSDTLDIVLNTIKYDLGYLSNWGLSNICNDLANQYDLDLASRFAKSEASITTKMTTMIEKYAD